MVVQKALKTYPMVKWFLVVSAILVAAGLVMSRILTDPNDADTTLFLYFLVPAIVLPFLALAFPRRQVVTMELPSDALSSMSRDELEGLVQQLDAARAKGDMDAARHANARERVLAAIKAKGKAK